MNTMLPTTPSKKALTDDMRNAIDASNKHCDTIVPEDLSVALQSLGSRVRKSVTEGYAAQHLTTFTVPVTPFSSPAKPPTTQTTPTPLSTNTNEPTFHPGDLRVPLTPSPRKRPRAEVEPHDEQTRRVRDVDVDMNGDGVDSEDDQVTVILGPDANANVFSLPRKIKPLPRSMAQGLSNDASTDFFAQTAGSILPSLYAQNAGVDMDLSGGTAT